MRCRIAAWAACSLLIACSIAACGGSSGNGVASKSADAIVTAAVNAADSAKSAHISGRIGGTTSTALNLNLVSGKGGRGHITVGQLSLQLDVVGSQVFINAPAAFWQHRLGATAAAQLQDKWAKVPAGSKFASLAPLTNLRTLLGIVLSTHGKLVKGKTTTVDGQSAVAVHDAAGNATIYVATTGAPYPLEIVEPGAQGGQITLDHMDDSVNLTVPSDAINVAGLK
jgi:hypothetical protein